jgi:hypothetical protein
MARCCTQKILARISPATISPKSLAPKSVPLLPLLWLFITHLLLVTKDVTATNVRIIFHQRPKFQAALQDKSFWSELKEDLAPQNITLSFYLATIDRIFHEIAGGEKNTCQAFSNGYPIWKKIAGALQSMNVPHIVLPAPRRIALEGGRQRGITILRDRKSDFKPYLNQSDEINSDALIHDKNFQTTVVSKQVVRSMHTFAEDLALVDKYSHLHRNVFQNQYFQIIHMLKNRRQMDYTLSKYSAEAIRKHGLDPSDFLHLKGQKRVYSTLGLSELDLWKKFGVIYSTNCALTHEMAAIWPTFMGAFIKLRLKPQHLLSKSDALAIGRGLTELPYQELGTTPISPEAPKKFAVKFKEIYLQQNRPHFYNKHPYITKILGGNKPSLRSP